MITYKYKLYRTKKTKHLDDMLRTACWVWNHALALQKRYYRMYGGYIDVVKMQKKWVRWYGTSALGSTITQEILQRLDISYMRFFKHIQRRPPKFKTIGAFSSIVFKKNSGYTLNGNVITIKKINQRFKFSLSRPYDRVGIIRRIIIKRHKSGDYYLYIFFKSDPQTIEKSHNGASVGIDFGLKTYLTLSNGEQIQSPRFLKKSFDVKRRADRSFGMKQKGSNHRQSAMFAKNKLEEDIVNHRDNWQWEQAHKLCRRFDIICIEDLILSNMSKQWGQKMQDLAHYKFVQKLEYLGKKYGVTIIKIERYFPSSKLCDCGFVHKDLALHDRKWTCPVCGRHHNRDIHAANNILRQGIASLGSLCKTRKPGKVTTQGRKTMNCIDPRS